MTDPIAAGLGRLAEACRILAMEGHDDMTLGHLAWRDPAGRGFWLKRNRIGLEEVRGPDDFVLVSPGGEKLAGEGGLHSEWPIHAEVLAARPDIAFVAHTHPPHASALSAGDGWLRAYTVDADYFEMPIPVLRETAALIVEPAQGRALAAALGGHRALFLASHGVVFVGATVEELACTGAFLERAARAHLRGIAAGVPDPALPPSVRALRRGQVMTPRHWEHSHAWFLRRLARAEGGG